MKRLVQGIALVAALALQSGCGCGARTNMVDYCYVQSYHMNNIPKQYFQLRGHRAWDIDLRIGTFESIDEAKRAAETLSCSIR